MFFLCLRENIRPRNERTVAQGTHMKWMQQRHTDGSILMSGPNADRTLGMYLIRADGPDEADRIARSDPYTVAGDCRFRLIQWEVHQIMGIGSFDPADLAAPPADR